jgi:hypothetical protein
MTTTAKQGENLTIDNIRVAPLGALTGSWTYRANTAARYGQQFHSGYVILNPNSAAQNP